MKKITCTHSFFQNMVDRPIKFYSAGGKLLVMGQTAAFPWGQ